MEQHLTGALAENGISLWGGSIPELELKLELLGGDLIQRMRGGRVGESEITCKLAFQDENETETRLGCFYATVLPLYMLLGPWLYHCWARLSTHITNNTEGWATRLLLPSRAYSISSIR